MDCIVARRDGQLVSSPPVARQLTSPSPASAPPAAPIPTPAPGPTIAPASPPAAPSPAATAYGFAGPEATLGPESPSGTSAAQTYQMAPSSPVAASSPTATPARPVSLTPPPRPALERQVSRSQSGRSRHNSCSSSIDPGMALALALDSFSLILYNSQYSTSTVLRFTYVYVIKATSDEHLMFFYDLRELEDIVEDTFYLLFFC